MISRLGLAVAAAPKASEALPMGYGWALFKMLVALVIVCALAYLALRFGLRRLAGGRVGASNMRVLDRCPLSAGRSLWIVEVAGRYFLLGDSEGGISNLAELAADEVPTCGENLRSRSFLDLLKRRGDKAAPVLDGERR